MSDPLFDALIAAYPALGQKILGTPFTDSYSVAETTYRFVRPPITVPDFVAELAVIVCAGPREGEGPMKSAAIALSQRFKVGLDDYIPPKKAEPKRTEEKKKVRTRKKVEVQPATQEVSRRKPAAKRPGGLRKAGPLGKNINKRNPPKLRQAPRKMPAGVQ